MPCDDGVKAAYGEKISAYGDSSYLGAERCKGTVIHNNHDKIIQH